MRGTLQHPRSYRRSARDHPRACGEHMVTYPLVVVSRGSSPRMRGTLARLQVAQAEDGIIPAHAGNTYLGRTIRAANGDHPRACGEHVLPAICLAGVPGSSPRMRGTLAGSVDGVHRAGIIPAHAGNTGLGAAKNPNGQDHPRACGEHDGRIRWGMAGLGSSPRMRGTPPRKFASYPSEGIIPAHAGNTVISVSFPLLLGDHPRACGEHFVRVCPHRHARGSSPRMRGTQRRAGPPR